MHEDPYKCSDCPRTFKNMDDLGKHQDLHNENTGAKDLAQTIEN